MVRYGQIMQWIRHSVFSGNVWWSVIWDRRIILQLVAFAGKATPPRLKGEELWSRVRSSCGSLDWMACLGSRATTGSSGIWPNSCQSSYWLGKRLWLYFCVLFLEFICASSCHFWDYWWWTSSANGFMVWGIPSNAWRWVTLGSQWSWGREVVVEGWGEVCTSWPFCSLYLLCAI